MDPERINSITLAVISRYTKDLHAQPLTAELRLRITAKREAWMDLAGILEIPQEDVIAARLEALKEEEAL